MIVSKTGKNLDAHLVKVNLRILFRVSKYQQETILITLFLLSKSNATYLTSQIRTHARADKLRSLPYRLPYTV